ncbi:MAG TPA: hydroxymethylbilane synthase [Solirubrobacteraceae bacterium]|nr:hydroxymethylbilane synthase [Solirubrobacteraceae bacterium]
MRLGTRGSALALAQAELVAKLLEDHAGEAVEIVPMVTRGDRESASVSDDAGELAGDGPPGAPPAGEDKSRWVSELERALAAGEIDAAVHSAKAVPGEAAPGLTIVAAPSRAASEDVLCGAGELAALAQGARVGTSSVRRVAQLRAAREDIEVVAMHGNVDTRLRKLGDSTQGLDAIVLARAGLQRLGREAEAGGALDFVPAPGQGTLALQAREEDTEAQAALSAIGDEHALACLLAERALARALSASCDTPLGAHASIDGEMMVLRAWVGLPDGTEWIADELSGNGSDPEALGRAVAQRMQTAGAAELLRRAGTATE